MFIGEAPGINENSTSLPFYDRAGKEFNNKLLPLAGLDRRRIYFTNCRKCRQLNSRKATPYEVHTCAAHFLPYELAIVDPKVVVLMGATACSLLEDQEIDLEVDRGRPRKGVLFGVPYWVIPIYHPAMGLHDSNKIRHLREDFTCIRRFIQSGFTWTGAKDLHAGREEYYLLGRDPDAPIYLSHCLERLRTGRSIRLATDTESVEEKIWSWQLSIEPGKSVMGYMRDREGVGLYIQALTSTVEIIMHFATHDVEELRTGGITWPGGRGKVRDTMQMAADLGQSQGLKALAGRHCGMKMKSYMEVVKPHSRGYVKEWLNAVQAELPKIETTYYTPVKKERKTKWVKNPLENKINALLRDMGKNPDFDPWKSWGKFKANLETEAGGEQVRGKKTFDPAKAEELLGWVEYVEQDFGRLPTVGLDKVPEDEAKWYGCRDSDANLRVWEVLDKMAGEFGKQVEEEDWDDI